MKATLFILSFLIFCSLSFDANAQFKNLGKKLKKKVEHRVDRKVDKAADDVLDEVEEGIEEGVEGEGGEESTEGDNTQGTPNNNQSSGGNTANTSTGSGNNSSTASNNDPGDFKVNTKFDFVPGSRLIVFEDFSADAMGDFPSRWNTNGTGEVVTFGDSKEKWFELKTGSEYLPDLPEVLPEEYTIEFDLVARGLDKQTPSSTLLDVTLDEINDFSYSRNYAKVRIPFCQYHPIGFRVVNKVDSKTIINNNTQGDIRKQVVNQPHISIAVNKTRFRLWVNEKKYIDIPRFVAGNGSIKYLRFEPHYFRDGEEQLFIRNLKISEGGLDLRSQLLTEGKVSTNGIRFDVNSATIKPESYGVIRQIALAMGESDMRVNIIGHTDSDGDDSSNQELSEQRAVAVKQALIKDFKIDASRMTVQGKGESQPVAENSSPEGKAANRRVEFVTL